MTWWHVTNQTYYKASQENLISNSFKTLLEGCNGHEIVHAYEFISFLSHKYVSHFLKC